MHKSIENKWFSPNFSYLAAFLACVSFSVLNISIASDKPAEIVPDATSIVFAASNDSSLPLAEFHGDQLVSGILKDLGDAIAVELHRKAKYVVIPRKRLDMVLTNGSVDGVCYYRPEWVAAPLNWTQALIPNEILLVAGTGVPKPKMLEDVAGMRIGVVLGYKYPELDALHQNYQPEEAPSMPSNIRKLIAGRMKYAVIDRLSLNYEEKSHREIQTFTTLSITKINASCGFSLTSKIPFNEIETAIGKIVNAGTADRILVKYR